MISIILVSVVLAGVIAYFAKLYGFTTFDAFKLSVIPTTWLNQSFSNNFVTQWFSTRLASTASYLDQTLAWTVLITLIVISLFVLFPLVDGDRRTNVVRR